MSARRFVVAVNVSPEFYDHDPEAALAEAQTMLADQAREDFRGPRGGRYVALDGPIKVEHDEGVQWRFIDRPRYVHTFSATVMARYVRPQHRTS